MTPAATASVPALVTPWVVVIPALLIAPVVAPTPGIAVMLNNAVEAMLKDCTLKAFVPVNVEPLVIVTGVFWANTSPLKFAVFAPVIEIPESEEVESTYTAYLLPEIVPLLVSSPLTALADNTLIPKLPPEIALSNVV